MTVYFVALGVILLVAAIAWVLSVLINDVSFVDSLWSLFFLIAALIFVGEAGLASVKSVLILALVSICRRTSLSATGANPRTIATRRSAPTTSPVSW